MESKKNVNTKEFLAHCSSIMQLLKTKAVSVEEAKVQSNLLKQANNLLRYELDRGVAFVKYDGLRIRDIEDGIVETDKK